MSILFVNNPSHKGISCIGEAYKKAFEEENISFSFMNFDSPLKVLNETTNNLIFSKVAYGGFEKVIFLQPTYFNALTYYGLLNLKKQQKIKFYSIQTEDPYSIEAMLQMNALFDVKFTNEIVCAHNFSNSGYVYLPVAFDSLQPYKKETVNEYDLAVLWNWYPKRLRYLDKLKKLKEKGMKIFIGGDLGFALKYRRAVDLTSFDVDPGYLPRHKELNLYSKSLFVLNLHRSAHLVGKSDFYVQGRDCHPLVNCAYSPNPRCFDAFGAGSIPLNDYQRKECFKIMDNYLLPHLPKPNELEATMECLLTERGTFQSMSIFLREEVLLKHTYKNRAQFVLETINAKS